MTLTANNISLPCAFHKLTVYETKTRLYIVGSNYFDEYQILKIDKTSANELIVTQDHFIYKNEQCQDVLKRIHLGNKHNGGLNRVLTCFGIVGFIRFTEGFYMCLITKRKVIANIGGNYIYHIEDTTLINVCNPFYKLDYKGDEERYLTIFQNVDLNKNFYFSYTFNLTQNLQANVQYLQSDLTANKFSYQSKFVWNHYLLQVGFGPKCLDNPSNWILPLIHGFVDQAQIAILSKRIYVTLIARRSRHFAGARFLKRGADEEGHVANEVETEQIVHDPTITPLVLSDGSINPSYTSYLQHRGSIPLSWGQDTSSMAPKPPINILKRDPFATMAAKHFDDLFNRYGAPLIVLNLIKKKEKTPRESKVLAEFTRAVEYLQSTIEKDKKLFYIDWDMSRASKSPDEDVIGYLEMFGEDALQYTHFFHSGPSPYFQDNESNSENVRPNFHPYEQLLQHGIVRTNCIDCIDRTNAAQFLIGKCALAYQLNALSVINETYLPFDCEAIDMLTEMYHDHGDTLALQYGGSNLVNTMATYRKRDRNWSSHSRDIIEAIRRFYTNSFVDADKQDAMNLFLGVYKVGIPNQPKLWDLPTDYYLHNPPSTRFDEPKYIQWFSDNELLNGERNLPLNQGIIKNKNKNKPFKLFNRYPLYWIEYYRPRQLSTFSRLLAFNLNGNNLMRDLNSEEDSILSTLSPFKVTEDNELQKNDLNNNIVRFGKWMSLQRRGNQGKSAKSRLSNLVTKPNEADDESPQKERKELLRLPENELTTIINSLSNPETLESDFNIYNSYIDNLEYNELQDENTRSLYQYNQLLATGSQPVIPLSDTQVYRSYIERSSQIKWEWSISETERPIHEAYKNYLNKGKFKLPREKGFNESGMQVISPYSTMG